MPPPPADTYTARQDQTGKTSTLCAQAASCFRHHPTGRSASRPRDCLADETKRRLRRLCLRPVAGRHVNATADRATKGGSSMHREFLRTAPLVLMLLGATVVAPAQQPSPPADAQQQSQQEKAQQTQSGKTGTVEPSALAPTDKPPANAVFFNGALAVPDVPANSQTVPAKFSPQNAADDKLVILAYTFKMLSEEERGAIYQALKD